MTRVFVSDKDYSYFDAADAEHLYLTCIYTEDKNFSEKFHKLGLNIVMEIGQDEIRLLFLAKEKGEIAMLKAIGFKNVSLAVWQTLRIGIVLFISSVIGTALSTPISHLCVTPIFQMMGAQSIAFDIRPMEVYILYPMVVFAVTVTAGMCAAMQVKKILASDASNLE